jgi:hypothetical protein
VDDDMSVPEHPPLRSELYLYPQDRPPPSATPRVGAQSVPHTEWWYRDQDRTWTRLGDTHTLQLDLGETQPGPSIELSIHNCVGESICVTFTQTSLDADVQPRQGQIDHGCKLSLEGSLGGGIQCETESRCAEWSFEARPVSADSKLVIPDPTFKVRWKAHQGDSPP